MKNITPCPCCCHIIPDVVIKKLKKEGYDVPSTQSNKENEDFRMERATFMTSGRSLMAVSNNNGQRLVYDSQNQAKKKLKLVRKDGDKAVTDVDVNAAYDHQLTALMWAAGQGHTDAVTLLLERGARADVKDDRGLTALDMARQGGHAAAAEALQGR